VALHNQAFTSLSAMCTTDKPTIPCSDYDTDFQPTLVFTNIYLAVVGAEPGPGIAGVSCGISTSGAFSMSGWTLCADLDFPAGNWFGGNGGNRITWASASNCQQTEISPDGVHAIAGAFYGYAYGNALVEVTRNETLAIPELKVADCAANESDVDLAATGAVGFGTLVGRNPCNAEPPVSTAETIWSRIKRQYSGGSH
jgi:hypothetical protein